MNQPPQQPLEFSAGMRVAVGLVTLLAVVDLIRNDQQDAKVVRRSEQQTDLERLGLRVRPVSGWSHLSTSRRDQLYKATFMNVAALMTVRLHPFPFESWPPSEQELAARDIKVELGPEDIDQVDYAHVSIQWLKPSSNDSPHEGQRVGRLHQDAVDVMVTVQVLSGATEVDERLGEFFDAIEIIDSRGW